MPSASHSTRGRHLAGRHRRGRPDARLGALFPGALFPPTCDVPRECPAGLRRIASDPLPPPALLKIEYLSPYKFYMQAAIKGTQAEASARGTRASPGSVGEEAHRARGAPGGLERDAEQDSAETA